MQKRNEFPAETVKAVGTMMCNATKAAERAAPKGMTGMRLSLPKKQFGMLEKIAEANGVAPEKLAEKWLAERINHENNLRLAGQTR